MRDRVNLLFVSLLLICGIASRPAHAINCTGISKNAEGSWLGQLACDAPVTYTYPQSPQTPQPVETNAICDAADSFKYERITAVTLAKYIQMYGPVPIFNLPVPQICVISYEELNDPRKFSVEPGRIVGRYRFENGGVIYITPAALKPQNTDLAHELVHHFNAVSGITDAKLDEKMAYAFEARYASEY